MNTVDDREGEFSFRQMFRESFIRAVLKIALVITHRCSLFYLITPNIHVVVPNMKINTNEIQEFVYILSSTFLNQGEP